MNPSLARLQPYPFERLRTLLAGAQPPSGLPHIAMSIGEPRHTPPQFVLDELSARLDTLSSYPATLGVPQLRSAIAGWLSRRFQLPPDSVDADTMILPVNGTREALFAFVQACVDRSVDRPIDRPADRPTDSTNGRPAHSSAPLVVMPNPFYQIYEGAALLAGAQPWFMGNGPGNDPTNEHLPDLDSVPAAIWERCQLLFLCSPGNPTGAVASVDYLRRALQLADRYDFVVASDECYSEIYLDESSPPPGLLQAAIAAGHDSFERCMVFHSLSKRSSLPGLRSGFVAGDPVLIKPFLLYRTYHGCAMPLHTQFASVLAWNDDEHVIENRRLYRQKFAEVLPILRSVMEVPAPDAGFYLWPRVDNDERFTRELFERQHVTVLPGSYIARESTQVESAQGESVLGNPGRGRVRISLVANGAQCVQAAQRIRDYVAGR